MSKTFHGPRTQTRKKTNSVKVHPAARKSGAQQARRGNIGLEHFEDGDSDDIEEFPTLDGGYSSGNASQKHSPTSRALSRIPEHIAGNLLSSLKPAWKMVPRGDKGSKRNRESMLKFRRALLKIANRRRLQHAEKPRQSVAQRLFKMFSRQDPGGKRQRRLSQATKPQHIQNLLEMLESHQSKLSVARTDSKLNWRIISRDSARAIKDKKNIVTEQQEQDASRQRCVVNHDSFCRELWDLFMEFFIIILALWVPVQLAFCFPDAQDAQHDFSTAGCPSFAVDFGICLFIQLVLTVDIFLNFFTSAVTEKGEEITSRRQIAMSYVLSKNRRCVRMEFLCDVISAIPVIFYFQAERYTNTVRVLRLLVLTKMFKVPIILIRLEDRLQLDIKYADFMKLGVIFVLVSHLFSCLFFLTSDVNNAGFMGVTEDPHNSWIASAGMYQCSTSLRDKYVVSLYWFMATLFTVGYGDVVPQSSFERVYAIIAMIIGCAVYSFVIGTVTQLMMRVGTHEQVFRNKMKEIDAFLNARDVPVALQVRIRMYFHHYYRKKTAFDERQILKNLSVFLRRELGLHLLDSSIFKIPLFQILVQDMDMELVAALLKILRPFQCTPGSMLFTASETGEQVMFVITKGEMNELYEADVDVRLHVTDGMCVGEMYAFGVTVERITTVVSRTSAEVFELNIKELRKFLFEKPQIFLKMKAEALDKLKQLRSIHAELQQESKVSPNGTRPDWKLSPSTKTLDAAPEEKAEMEDTIPHSLKPVPEEESSVEAQADAILAAMKPKLEVMVRDVVKRAMSELQSADKGHSNPT